ncbi:ABC transporter permease subunit [Ignavibacterium sp.]|uniref:ABC transporter permease n=1 Tax=Ignavibacterium sp. TaxID=2651167 RepID=UPI00220D91EF|nr:ABC transporter permease subunit [Ignavibacterium sp.]BDQ04407.1 MAG: ABC transporter permease [Ignavibacterium sp.]
MFTLVSIELYKIFRKWRTYIGFAAIGVLVPIIHIAMVYEGKNTIDFMTRNIQQSFVFVGNLLNTYLISYIVLTSLTVHIPFLITLVAGDLLAGEATAGTYRLMLTRPVTREKFVIAKFIAGVIYTNLLILWLALMSLVVGYFIFGVGELLIIRGDMIIIFEQKDVLWRFLGAYGYASLGMTVVASLAYLFSSLVENAIGPIVSTMAVIIVFVIISAINVDLLQAIRPYLFTNYISSWQLFFDNPVDVNEILKSIGILVLHIAIFFGATLIIFKRKDILT